MMLVLVLSTMTVIGGLPTLEPTLDPTHMPTPAPTILRDPDHEFDFRGCSDSSATADTGVEGTNITATAKDDAYCSDDGIVLDGSGDYVDVTPWLFGGKPMTVEAYVKYDLFNSYSRIFEFGEGVHDDVVLSNDGTSATGVFATWDGSSYKVLYSNSSSFYEASNWVHVVATVDGTTMMLYKDGGLDNTKIDGLEPPSLTRLYHWIGRSAWGHEGRFDGTIAYLRFWHGEA